MAALNFPSSPSDGDTYTPSGSTITYTYSSSKGSWQGQLSGSAATVVSLTGSTNNQLTTVTGANAIQGESNLTFDGSTLAVTGAVTISSNITVEGTTTLNGNLVLGDAAADTLTIGATLQGASPLTFEGGTANGFETTFAITDPTADRTITFPDATGTVAFTSSNITGNAATVTSAANNSTNETVYLTFVDGQTGAQEIETDSGLTYNPSTGLITTTSISAGTVTSTGNVVIADAGNIGSASDTNAIAIGADGDVTLTQDLELQHDGATISFGANDEIVLTHEHNSGLSLTHTATGDNQFVKFKLKSSEESITVGEALGSIEFESGDTSGTDANAVAASITAVSSSTFSSSMNNTRLEIALGASESAAFGDKDPVFTLTNQGGLTLGTTSNAYLRIGDGAAIGNDSLNSVMTLAATGIVTFVDDIIIKDSGTIGSSSDPDAIEISSAGVVSFSAATEASATGTAAVTTAGGLGVAKDMWIGDDIVMDSDAAVIKFGDNQEVELTHVHDTGLLLNGTMQLQFGDSGTYIHQSANGVLDLVSDNELELNATTIDINGNVDVSGTYTGGGLMTTGGNIVIPDGGNIGSASDTDAISVAGGGAVTLSQRSVHSAGITIANGGEIGSVGDGDSMAIASDGVVTFTQRAVFGVGGITIPNDGQIGSTGDTDAIVISASGDVTYSQQIYTSDGTASNPAIAFSDDTDTGWYSATDGEQNWSLNGTMKMHLDSTGLDVEGTVLCTPTATLTIADSGGTVQKTIHGVGST